MGLFPLSSLFSRPCLSAIHKAARPSPTKTARYFAPNSSQSVARYQHSCQHQQTAELIERYKWTMKAKDEMTAGWHRYVLKIGLSGLGLGMTFLAAPVLYCDPVTSKTAPPAATLPPSQGTAAPVQPTPPPPPPPSSSVNFYELTFGTVCGVCAGVFVKKGVKAAAFVLGGVFVLLQYLGSLSLVRVNWNSAATRFENLFYSKDPVTGAKRPPNVGSLFRWIIDFLTADFQGRASFVAGFTLGLRIG